MNRLKLGILVFVLVVAGSVALLIPLHNYRAKRALLACKAGLIAKGEKLTIEELTPVSSPEAKTAANDLVQAAWQLRQGLVIPINMPIAMGFVLPGKASVGWRQPEILDLGHSTNSWEELAQDLNANAAALEQIREVLKSPQFDMNLNYQMGFSLLVPHLSKFKGLAQWLMAATMNDLHAGRLNEATTNLNALLALAHSFRDEKLIISQLVRIAITAIAIGPAWEALQTEGWSDSQLAGLQTNWESLEFQQSMEDALSMERSIGIEMFERLRYSRNELRDLLDANSAGSGTGSSGLTNPTGVGDVPDFLLEWSKQALSTANAFGRETAWRWLWSYDDELRYVQTLQLDLEVSHRARRGGSFTDAQAWGTNEYQRLWRRDDSDSPKYVVSRLIGPALERASAKAARLETARELVVSAIAVKRFQLRHGRLPPDLKSLVPEFLSQLPVDLMDGQAVRYRANEDGTFLLYSVGEDGRDDGGDASPNSPGSRASFFSATRDMVWPMPASAVEITEAEMKAMPKNRITTNSIP